MSSRVPGLLYSVLDTYPKRTGIVPKRPLVARDDRPTIGRRQESVACRRCGVTTGNTTDAVCLACEQGRAEYALLAIHEYMEIVPDGEAFTKTAEAVQAWAKRNLDLRPSF